VNRHPATDDPKGHRGIGHRRGALLQKPSGVWAVENEPNVHLCGQQWSLAKCRLGEYSDANIKNVLTMKYK
jgi:hypothetical protein